MKKATLTLSYDEEKLNALKIYIGQKNTQVEDELVSALDVLYKAYRAEGRSEENRREIFFNALEGKEIDLTESVPDEDENESPMMQM